MTSMTSRTADGISAAFLAAATNGDPQFALPERPRVVPSLQQVWLDDGLVIDGGMSRRHFRGESVRALLPRLMPLLDGSRDHEELAREVELKDVELRQMLSTMFAAGMLIDGPPYPDGGDSDAYFERMADASRRNRSIQDVRAKLESRSVLVVGEGAPAVALRRALTESHLMVATDDTAVEDVFLCVIIGLDEPASRQIEKRARIAGVPLYPVQFGEFESSIGPISHHDFGPCLACIGYAVPANGGALSETGLRSQALLVAIELTLIVADAGRPASEKSAIGIRGTDLLTSTRWVPRRAECSVCGAGQELDVETEIAYRYETSVEFPPRRLGNPRDHQGHFESGSVRLTYDRRSFPEAPLVELPPGEPVDDAHRSPLGELARLLLTAFGYKPEAEQSIRPRRWAPSGGNLGSPQAYLTVTGMPGLVDGDYAYVARDHALALLKAHASDVSDQPTRVELFVVNELGRVWKKYSAFAYRVTALDAGVVIAHLSLVAATLAVTIAVQPGWSESETVRRYGLDRSQQSISARIILGRFT